MLFCKVSFVYVCLYVFYAAIYFRVWLCGCGRENVRIFPGSAPEAFNKGLRRKIFQAMAYFIVSSNSNNRMAGVPITAYNSTP